MEKIEQFDIALRLAGFNFKKEGVDLIMDLYDLMKSKGGNATLKDVTQIINENEQKYKDKK